MRSCLYVGALALLMMLSQHSLAHKIIFDVFTSAGVIEGELGFSSGEMAVDQTIQVLDAVGNTVGQATTDNDGFFVYTPTQATGLVFKADLGAGHVAKVNLSAQEVAEAMGVIVANGKSQSAKKEVQVVGVEVAAVNNPLLGNELAKLSADIKQLRKEIKAYKEKNDLQTILGGIGYIFGLFGLAFYLAARRKLGQK